MKTKLTKLFTTLAIAVGLASAATAATPVALWDGFSSLTSGDCTLTKIGGSFADGAFTVGSDGGFSVAKSSGNFGYQTTVIIDAEVPELSSDGVLITLNAGDSAQTSLSSKGTTLRQRWCMNGTDYGTLSDWAPTTRHRIAFAYYGNSSASNRGTTTYIDGVQKMDKPGLMTANSAVSSIYLGQYSSGSVAQDMKIYRVAIFETKLTADEIAAYQFPSEKKPLVVWSKDLAAGSVKNGFTMTFGNNAAASSGNAVLTGMTSGKGLTGVAIDWDTSTFNGQTMTVLVKYSGMTQSGFKGHTALLATYWGEANKDKEILLNANSGAVKLAYNVTSSNSGNNDTYWSLTTPSAGLLCVRYSSTGIRYTFLTESDGVWTTSVDKECTTVDGLKKSAPFYGLKVGGTIAGTASYYRPGMTVEGVAVYDSEIVPAELANYDFDVENVKQHKRVAWNTDLADGSRKGKFKMNVAGSDYATAADGIVTVTQKNSGTGKDAFGVKITWPDPADDAVSFTNKDMTVLVKYSDAAFYNANTAFFSALWGNTDKEYVYSSNGSKVRGTKYVWSTDYSDQGTEATYTPPTTGLMLITMKADGSTAVAFSKFADNAYADFSQAASYSNVRDANQTFYGIKIAGSLAAFSHYYRPGMKVSAVAILDKAYTATTFPKAAIDAVLTVSGDHDAVSYAKTIDAAATDFSDIAWTPTMTGLPFYNDNLDFTNTEVADATVTFDASVEAAKLTLTSAAGMDTTFAAASGKTVSIGAYDFSAANGKSTIDFSTGSATITPGANTVLNHIPDAAIAISADKKLTLGWDSSSQSYAKVLSGAGAVDITGNVLLGANNTLTGTMTVKNGGTLTMDSASCLNSGNAVTIEQGGVVDNNGKYGTCNSFTLAGGTLVNNLNELPTSQMQMAAVTVTADSTIGGAQNFGLLNSGYKATTLTLNENTTLTKTGANSFWLVTTTVNGTGTLSIQQGTINCVNRGSGSVNFQNATVELDGGNLEVNKATTLKNLSYKSGTLKANAAISGLTDISGNFDTTSSSQLTGSGALGFADTVNFHDGTIILNESILATLGTTKTVTIGDNGILDIRADREINVASIGTDAKLAVKQAESGEDQTITITGTSLADGDYLDKVRVIEAADDAVTMPIKSAAVSSGTLTITLDKTVFAYAATENTTISAIETACMGAGKTFEEASQLTITATGNPTITVDKSLNITKFALVGAATLKFNSGCTIAAATISATDAVTIDCASVTASECALFSGTIEDSTKFTAINAPSGYGAYIIASGVTMRKTGTGTRNNPVVTSETSDFTEAFFGSSDSDWATTDNWRSLTTVDTVTMWTPYTASVKAPALPNHNADKWKVLFDGALMGDNKVVTSSETVEGWAIEYAFLNGVDVTFGLNKIKCDSGSMFIWVDGTSKATINNSVTGQRGGTLNLYIANQDGLTFGEAWDGGSNAFNYYFKGAGTVNYEKGVTAGTHKIAQLEVKVGAEAKSCHTVAKQKLVNLGATSSVTFSLADGFTATCDNTGITPTYQDTIPVCTNEVGVYTIATESDGVYAYVVAYSDAWDLVEPLGATLTANANFSEIAWTDYYGHAFTNPEGSHTYNLTGGVFVATQNAAFGEDSIVNLASGTLLLDTAVTIGTETYTIDEGATLYVKTSGLKASQVTNNGTIAFEGGDADDPIVITGDADFGVTTLAKNTYVLNTVSDNRIHIVTGEDATSSYALNRTDADVGFTSAALTNLTLVAKSKVWLERVTLEDVRIQADAELCVNAFDPTIIALSGSGSVTKYGTVNSVTICCKQASTYSGSSSLPFTIAGTAKQTLTGAYTGALTVNEGATVALGGSANPSSIDNNGTVEWLKAYAIDESRAFDPELGTVVFTGGLTAKQTRAEYANGIASAFTGFPNGTAITLTKVDGTTENLTVDETGKASSTPSGEIHIDGKATIFDVTFTNLNDVGKSGNNTGTFSYKAVSDAKLKYDTGASFYQTDPDVEKERGVYIKHHPYIDGVASTFYELTDFTTVVVGQMSPSNNTQFIHFGSCLNSNPGLLIATTENKDEVAVLRNAGTTLTEIKRLSVPNAATARHVYIITKKDVTATADEAAHSVFTVYLDGVKKATVPMDGIFKLGASGHSGVQVGSAFGGNLNSGTYKAVAADDAGQTGYISVLRVYDYLMTDAQATALTGEYPYESQGGLFLREVESAANYAAENTWKKNGEETAAYEVPTGVEGFKPSATLEATEAATVTVNTNSQIDVFTFNGKAMSFVKDASGTNAISVSTAVINAPVTVEYGAVDLKGATVALSDSGSLAFDFSKFDVRDYFTTTKIQLTGLTEQNNEKITATLPTATYGRTTSFAFEGSEEGGEYYLTVTVDTDTPFIFTIAAEAETGTWTFGGAEVTESVVKQDTTHPVWKEGAGTLTNMVINRTYLVKEGTMVAGNAKDKTGTVTVNAGGTFDFNGQKDGYTTINLNGGSLVNNGVEMGTGSRQIEGVTLTANSTIGGTNTFGMSSNGHHANTLALGGYTLTKVDTNTFFLCNTTVTNGAVEVEGGTLQVAAAATFTSDATLTLGADTTLDVDSTLNIGAITGNGGTIDNAGTISAFTLTGSATLAGNGTYRTVTLAENAVANVGNLRGLTFAGAGTVDVKLTEEEDKYGKEITAFTKTDAATTTVGTVKDKGGNAISADRLVIDGNKIKIILNPTVFTVTSISSTAQTNFNGSAVVVNYSAFSKGDYKTVTTKLTVNGNEYVYDGTLNEEGGMITFQVANEDAAAGYVKNAVVSVVGTEATHAVVEDVSTAYNNTAFLYQGARSTAATNGWFSTSATGTTLNEQGGAWSPTPTAKGSKIIIDEDDEGEYHDFTFTPSPTQEGQVTVVDMDIAFDAALDSMTNMANVQAALRIVTIDESAGTFRFAAFADGVWKTNTTIAASIGSTYPVRLTFNYRTVPATVAYAVKVNDAYEEIASGVSGATMSALQEVTFSGTGKLSVMTGSNVVDSVDASLVEDADGNKYANVTEALAAGKTNLKLLWNMSWTPSMAAGEWTLAANGHKLYWDAEDGLLVTVDGEGNYRVITSYYEAVNLLATANGITTNKFMFFTNAVAQAADSSVTNLYLLRDVTLGETLAVNRDIWFNGESNILSGAVGLNVASGKTFTIEGGHIGITASDGVTLTGGRFTADSKTAWDAKKPADYTFSQLAVAEREGYVWQLIKTAVAPDPEKGEAVLPVKTAEGESVSVVVNTNWTEAVTGTKEVAAQSAALSVKQDNGLTFLDNAVLGLTNSAGKADSGNIPVILPVQAAKADKVTFLLGNVSQKSITESGARVSYRVFSSKTPGGKDGASSAAAAPTATTEMSLPTDGVLYYTIEVDTGTVK